MILVSLGYNLKAFQKSEFLDKSCCKKKIELAFFIDQEPQYKPLTFEIVATKTGFT